MAAGALSAGDGKDPDGRQIKHMRHDRLVIESGCHRKSLPHHALEFCPHILLVQHRRDERDADCRHAAAGCVCLRDVFPDLLCSLELFLPGECKIALALQMPLLDLHEAAPRYIVKSLAAVLEQCSILARIIAECRDTHGEVRQIFISDPCCLCVRYDDADPHCDAFPAQVQQFIVILEIQLFERRQVIDDQYDLRQVCASRLPICCERADSDRDQTFFSLFHLRPEKFEQVLELLILRSADNASHMVQAVEILQHHGCEVKDIDGYFLRRISGRQTADDVLQDIRLASLGGADDDRVLASHVHRIDSLILVVRIVINTEIRIESAVSRRRCLL